MKISVKVESPHMKLAGASNVISKALKGTIEASLLVIKESVLPYPPPPITSTYIRTGTLGRSLGSKGVTGGGKRYSAEFGTELNYAPYVIGMAQAWMHKGRWWRLEVEVFNRALPKIYELVETMANNLAKWLDRL
jgi:hypothetical protein